MNISMKYVMYFIRTTSINVMLTKCSVLAVSTKIIHGSVQSYCVHDASDCV